MERTIFKSNSKISKVVVNHEKHAVENINFYKATYKAPFNREGKWVSEVSKTSMQEFEAMILDYVEYLKNRIDLYAVGQFEGYAYEVDMENEEIKLFFIFSSKYSYMQTHNRFLYKSREDNMPTTIQELHFKHTTSASYGKFYFNKINITADEYKFFRENFEISSYIEGEIRLYQHFDCKNKVMDETKRINGLSNYLVHCLDDYKTYFMYPLQVIHLSASINKFTRIDNFSIGHFKQKIKNKKHIKSKYNKHFIFDKKINTTQDFIDFIAITYTKKDTASIIHPRRIKHYFDFSKANETSGAGNLQQQKGFYKKWKKY